MLFLASMAWHPWAQGSEVAGDFSEIVHRVTLACSQRSHEVFQAVIKVTLNQGLFGLLDRLLHRLQLLRYVQATTPLDHHVYRAVQMPTRSAQTFDDGGMGFMCVRLCHGVRIP